MHSVATPDKLNPAADNDKRAQCHSLLGEAMITEDDEAAITI